MEVETSNEDLSAKQKQQLNQRELFLSKQVEILPATNIRGKCSVTLLNETESFASYVEKEVPNLIQIKNWFRKNEVNLFL